MRPRCSLAANAVDVEAADACVAATIERFGPLDILVNNAAASPYAGPTMGVDPARFDTTFQVNIRGPVFWCQSAWNRSLLGQDRLRRVPRGELRRTAG